MYKINDIFYEDEEYSLRAEFCNENNLLIVEIEADDNGRRFQIQEPPKPTEKELAEMRIFEIKQKLAETDYQAIKFAEGELTYAEFAPIKAQRKAWRDEINALEKSL